MKTRIVFIFCFVHNHPEAIMKNWKIYKAKRSHLLSYAKLRLSISTITHRWTHIASLFKPTHSKAPTTAQVMMMHTEEEKILINNSPSLFSFDAFCFCVSAMLKICFYIKVFYCEKSLKAFMKEYWYHKTGFFEKNDCSFFSQSSTISHKRFQVSMFWKSQKFKNQNKAQISQAFIMFSS